MKIAVVNRLGFFMALAAFGLAYTMRLHWSWLNDGIFLAIAATLCFGLDIFWRVGKGKRKWFRASSGGTLLYMPLWFLALAWLALSAYQTYVKPIPALASAADRMTWTTSAPAQPQPQSQTQSAHK